MKNNMRSGSDMISVGFIYLAVHEKKVKKISEMKADTSQSSEDGSYSQSSISSGHLSNGGSSDTSFSLSNSGSSFAPGGMASLRFPVVHNSEKRLMAKCRRVYPHAHDYRINSISFNSYGATFISADDLRIHLWDLEINSQCFNIIDLKPTNVEDLTGLRNQRHLVLDLILPI